MTRTYCPQGYRETATATEYRRPDGTTVQACGKGEAVRRMLREGRGRGCD